MKKKELQVYQNISILLCFPKTKKWKEIKQAFKCGKMASICQTTYVLFSKCKNMCVQSAEPLILTRRR